MAATQFKCSRPNKCDSSVTVINTTLCLFVVHRVHFGAVVFLCLCIPWAIKTCKFYFRITVHGPISIILSLYPKNKTCTFL